MEFEISGRKMGSKHLTLIIAEIGINHGQVLKQEKIFLKIKL
jgi:sialic acid synthase SpsE